jgi:hypothetical protein
VTLVTPALLLHRRLWFNRPLYPQAVQYAADDVRYLLPVAHSLLQQLPGALLRLSSLQMQLAQQGEGAMQLQQRLLSGYSPLLQQQQQQVVQPNPAGSGAAASLQRLPGLTGIQFELQLSSDAAGWHQGSYVVYRNEQQQQQGSAAGGDIQAATTAVALAGTSDSAALVAPCTGAVGATMQQQQQLGGMHGHSDVDEAVQSMMQLLPDRWVPSYVDHTRACHQAFALTNPSCG